MGPDADLTSLDSEAFLNRLILMVEESLSLGWVDGVETVALFKAKLARAGQAIRDKELMQAKALLEEVIQEAERRKETKLTSEAYAIVRFNAQYLIQTLR